MKLAGSGFGLNARDVVRPHTTAGHNDDTSVGLTHQLAEEGDTLHGGSFLAGGEHAIDTVTDQQLKCGVRIAADVEGAMKGDLKRAGGGHKSVKEGLVDVAVGR